MDHPDSGIALIIVMITITVLSILAAGFAYSMKVETKLAQNSNSEQELYWLGRSGVDYCRWVLSQTCPNEPYDALNQRWAGGQGGQCTNQEAADIQDTVHLGDGSFTWKITDLDRKVNINSAGPDALKQAFLLVGVDAGDIDAYAAAIQDWIDPGEDTLIGGAESDYYQGLDPPYYAKDAPIDDLSELLLVRDISPDIYWGGVASNHPPARFQSKFGSSYNFNFNNQQTVYPVGLHELFTPLSSGRVNINTASLIQLQMIPGVDENAAGAIIQMRAGPDGVDGTDDDTPFQNPGELVNIPGMNNQLVGQIGQFCTVRSAVFEIQIDADVAGYKRQFTAIVARNSPQDIQILSFYWK